MASNVPEEYKEQAEMVGEKIRERRLSKGWTAAQLGDKSGYTEGYILYVERGDRMPSLKALIDIADAFNIKLQTLLR